MKLIGLGSSGWNYSIKYFSIIKNIEKLIPTPLLNKSMECEQLSFALLTQLGQLSGYG